MFLILLAIAIISYFIIQQEIKRKSLPPGPFPFLFLGNFPQLAILCLRHGGIVPAMKKLREQYGDVYTMWLGPKPAVNLCSMESAKEVMINQGAHQTNRDSVYMFSMTTTDENGNARGVTMTNGEDWVEHRRFCLTTLRNFGMGRNIMEARINEEFSFQLAEVESEMKDGKISLPTHELTDLLVGSVINRLLFGYRFDKGSKAEFFRVKSDLDHVVDSMMPTDLLIREYWKNIPILKMRYDTMYNPQAAVNNFVRKNITKRQSEIASGEYELKGEGEDFIDAYLIEQTKRKESGQGTKYLDFEGLVADSMDLWLAGQETTSSTLQWAIHYLLEHPEVMKKCTEEIHAATNNGDRLLLLSDRNSTPFLIATLNETQRMAGLLNLNLWRETTAETHINGYSIPKGTTIAAQLSVLLKDDRTFEKPLEFNPSRYLGENGKELEQKTIPFGIGKRSCLGEGLARAELYLLLGNILSRYSLSVDQSAPPNGCYSTIGIANRPKHFKLILGKRN